MVQIITVSAPTAAYVAAAYQTWMTRPVERTPARKAMRELQVEQTEPSAGEQAAPQFASSPPLAFICHKAAAEGGGETLEKANQAYEDV
jgi:hypothetical protein